MTRYMASGDDEIAAKVDRKDLEFYHEIRGLTRQDFF
jgi:hypothetical protein